jgi:hypothetical protein
MMSLMCLSYNSNAMQLAFHLSISRIGLLQSGKSRQGDIVYRQIDSTPLQISTNCHDSGRAFARGRHAVFSIIAKFNNLAADGDRVR